MIHQITPSVDKKYWLKSLDTTNQEPNSQNSIKVPKIKFHCYETLGLQSNIPWMRAILDASYSNHSYIYIILYKEGFLLR